MSVCHSYLKFILPSLLIALIDYVQENNFHLTVNIDLVEVVYYLKQVFHLLYDKSITPAEA